MTITLGILLAAAALEENLHDPRFNAQYCNGLGEPGGMMRSTDQGADKIGPYDWSPGDVIWADEQGNIVLDDGITAWNLTRAKEFLKRARHKR